MDEIIAVCGLRCHECPAYLAHAEDDDKRRADTAELWSQGYGATITPDQIDCEGCLAVGGVLFQHCSVCEIRKCGLARGLANCAQCDDYACDRLVEFFKMVPDAQAQLHAMRESGREAHKGE